MDSDTSIKDDKDRIVYLESEITRLQEMCRTNFGVIGDLKKKNEKLDEIQLELKDTTSDLAYSLAECPWWSTSDQEPTLEAFRVLVTYAKNIQYILQLPIFFDPLEQLKIYGMSRERAIRFLQRKYARRTKSCYKCPKCKKAFTTEDRRKKHLEFHTNSKKKLHCNQCDRYIQSFRSFKSHLLSHQFTNQMMAFPPIRFSSEEIVQHSSSEIDNEKAMEHLKSCEDVEIIPLEDATMDKELSSCQMNELN